MRPDTPADLLPEVTADTAPFYSGLDEGRLMLQECAACGRVRYPIAPVCPFCRADAHRWRTVDGRGVVHSWVRYHRSFVSAFETLVPYVVLTVQLDEGPRLFGRLVGAEADTVNIGDRAKAVVELSESGRGVLAFTPTAKAQ
jgi:uncharacterized OB-fold protein